LEILRKEGAKVIKLLTEILRNEGAKVIIVKNKNFTERRNCTTDRNRGSPVGPT